MILRRREAPRGVRRMETMPFGSLIVCLALFVVQLASWPVLFMVGMQSHGNQAATDFLQIPMVLWLLLPAGSIYGLYLALRREASDFGDTPRALGIIANGLYLLFGIFIWMTTLFGGV